MPRRKRARPPDPRRAKIHHSYTIAETAALFGVHRNTVRCWIRNGLGVVKVGRSFLILGSELRDFLTRRRDRQRSRCGPGEMFCLKCRAPRRPPTELVEAATRTGTSLNLRGLCPECGTLMHRRTSRIGLSAAGFDFVPHTQGRVHLTDRSNPSVKCAQGEDV